MLLALSDTPCRAARRHPAMTLAASATLTVILIAVVILTAGCEIEEATEERSGEAAPLDVSVSAIYQAYQENEARANVTYKDKSLNLSFTVDEIEDKYVIQNLDPIGFVTAQLTFDQAELVQFNTGDSGTSICSLKGFELDLWLRFDCR